MSIREGFQWGSIILSLTGAFLAAYSSAAVPVDVIRVMTTVWGAGTIPARIVLDQKTYSQGALTAIALAVASQLVALLTGEQRGNGLWILTGALIVAAVLLVLIRRRARSLVHAYLGTQAKVRDSEGKLSDVVRVQDPTNPEGFIERIGRFYECPRRREEELDTYRNRVAEHINRLAY